MPPNLLKLPTHQALKDLGTKDKNLISFVGNDLQLKGAS